MLFEISSAKFYFLELFNVTTLFNLRFNIILYKAADVCSMSTNAEILNPMHIVVQLHSTVCHQAL